MAYPVTLSDLISRALQRAGLEGSYGPQQAYTPAEVTDLVNCSIAGWYDLVRTTTWGGQYFRATYTLSTAGQQQVYPMPQDMLSLLSIDCYLSSTWKIKARPYQEEESCMFTGPTVPVGWTFRTPVFYQMQGDNISFLPIPNGVYQVALNYVPVAPQLGAPSDTLDAINSWEEWIVLDVAQKMLAKSGEWEARAALLAERDREEMRIKSCAAMRDAGGAEVVHDVIGNGWGVGVGGFY